MREILLFLVFFGRPGNIFWFFWCIIRSLVVQTEFLKPRWTYPLGKKLWENFLSFPEYGRNFLNIHWSLLGMLSKLPFTCSQEHFVKGYFFRFFQNCFRALNDNPPDLWRKVSAASRKLHSTCRKNFSIFWQNFVMFHLTSCSSEKKTFVLKKKFRQFCQSCILNVRELFEEINSEKRFFFQFNLHFQPKLYKLWRNFSTESSTCILCVQRNTFTKTLCWLCETISDFGRGTVGFAAETLQPC